jgi:hypothetical protein
MEIDSECGFILDELAKTDKKWFERTVVPKLDPHVKREMQSSEVSEGVTVLDNIFFSSNLSNWTK